MSKPVHPQGGALPCSRLFVPSLIDLKMKAFNFLLLSLLAGCATDSALYVGDNSSLSQTMAQERAVVDLTCKEALADRPIRSERMEDWQDDPVYSEYKVWVEGCGKEINYVVVCRHGMACAFADQPEPQGQ